MLEQVEAGAFLAPALSTVLNRARLAGHDRSLVTDVVYGVMRWRSGLDAALAGRLRAPGRLPPRVLLALRAGAYELLIKGTAQHAAVSSWVEVVKREQPALSGLVNAVLRGVAKQPRAAVAVERTLPGWLWREFERSLGEHAHAAAAGMLEPEPLWLTAYAAGAEAALTADGCEVRRGPLPFSGPGEPWLPASLAVRAPAPLETLSAFADGLVQPQNPTSLFVAAALGARSGEVVYDLASGRGVKSAALAAVGAEVTAVELDARRSEAAERNLARLGLGARHVVADLLGPPPAALGAGAAQRVLLDAPCSGTGTLRGHPEIKLRLSQSDLPSLAARQSQLLANAAAFVAPGGTLLYAVCALTTAEGPDVAAGFHDSYPDFEPDTPACPLPHVTSGPGGLFVLSTEGLDGFYLARFRRLAG